MALSRIAAVLGGLLMSRGGRGFAGRHAGKLTLATLAWQLWQKRQGRTGAAYGRAPHPRQRWSGRRR